MADMINTLWDDGDLSTQALQEVEGFPYATFQTNLIRYEESEGWVSGAKLQDKTTDPGQEVDLYPLKINPLLSTIQKHAAVLFGETEEDGRPLVYPKFVFNNDGEKAMAEIAEEAINTIWFENNGRDIQMTNGLISQVFGGCVFKASYVPWEGRRENGFRKFPIRIDAISPKGFIGFPDGGDNYRLREAWIVRKMRQQEAKEYGYEGTEDMVWYAEHWTKATYDTFVDGKPAKFGGEELNGENPWGVVPMVYIPHLRLGNFYGVNVVDALRGMVEEINLRYGDFGDAVNDDAHKVRVMRNVTGSVTTKDIGNGIKVVDLGSVAAISGREGEPDLFEVGKNKASTAMKDLLGEIYAEYRRDSYVPAVADGEDEGSQRSGLTLAIRFWPLTSHVGIERLFWTAGLDVFTNILLRIMHVKKMGDIKEDHIFLRSSQKWSPMLPRDREIEIQELVHRSNEEMASIETLIEKSGDIEDVAEERARILAWITDVETIKAKILKEFAPEPTTPFGGGGNTPKPKKKSEAK